MSLLQSIHRVDTLMFMGVMNNRHYRQMTGLARIISRTADGPLYLLVAAGLYLYDINTGLTLLESLLLAFALERPLYLLIKNGFQRNRPAQSLEGVISQIKPADRFSFPSGHTSAAFLVATMLAALSPALAPWLYGWAALVGVSRLLLGVHFPTDILVGTGMGWSLGLISLNLMS